MIEIKDRFKVKFADETYDLHDREQRIEYGMKKWEKMIHGLACKYQNSVSGYDDFVQEALLIIIKAADGWIPERGNFHTFLFECIKNGIIDTSTRTRHAVSVPSGSFKLANGEHGMRTIRLNEDLPDESGNVYEHIDICDTIDNFDKYRVGNMYFVEHRTMGEISKFTGISVSTLHRMITEMRRLIQTRLQVC